jgi:hypothetical protein
MKRKIHTNKEIESAIQYAENNGWRYKATGNSAHAWGRLLCPLAERDGCGMSIYSTPRNNDVHAKQIRRKVNSCPHKKGEVSNEKNLSVHTSLEEC